MGAIGALLYQLLHLHLHYLHVQFFTVMYMYRVYGKQYTVSSCSALAILVHQVAKLH